jgi:Protein of unknown function (DUF2569)
MALFFQKRRIFPRWFIVLIAFNALFVVGDIIGVQFVRTSSPNASVRHLQSLMSVLVGCGIWIPYMLLSRRVKATFVR